MTPESIRMLAIILAIATGVWVGGLVTVTLVVVSSLKMGASDRVVLFRAFGRRFAAFFGSTGVFVIAPAVIVAVNASSVLSIAIAVLSVVLLFATVGGVFQARRMSAMRSAAVTDASTSTSAAEKDTLRSNAAAAAGIRALLVAGYVVLLVLATVQASAH